MAVEFLSTRSYFMVPVCLRESPHASIGHMLVVCLFVVACLLAPSLSCAYMLTSMLVEMSLYLYVCWYILLVPAFIRPHAGLFAYQLFQFVAYLLVMHACWL